MHLGVSVVIDDPEKLEAIRKRCSESLICGDENKHRVEVINFLCFGSTSLVYFVFVVMCVHTV